MSKFMFGSDPEFMLMHKGEFKSAIGVVPGTKDKHYIIGNDCFYYDNVMAECMIRPGSNKKDVIKNIREALVKYANIVKPCKLVTQAAADYPKSQLLHEDALKIGCVPEYCAYSLKMIPPPTDDFQQGTLRSAGGHIHIGWELAKNYYNALNIVRLLDLFLGIPSIYLDHDQTSASRKALYGKAGRYRRPKWGVEYRTLGDFWLSSPKLVELVYDICDFTLGFVESKKVNSLWNIDIEKLENDDSWADDDFDPIKCHVASYNTDEVRNAIETMNRDSGMHYMKMIRELMPKEIFQTIESISSRKKEFDLYTEWGI
jgi:hypothetical protein